MLQLMQDTLVTITTGAAVGLRERQKRARREALVDAAQRLVQAHGYDAVTVEEIAAEAGVSTRTFFNYFETKEDAVLGLENVEPDQEVANAFATGGPTGVLLADLAILATALLARHAPRRHQVHGALAVMRHEPHLMARHTAWMERQRTALAEIISARLAARPAPVDEQLLGMLCVVILHTASHLWEQDDFAGDPARHVDAAISQLRALLVNEPAPD
jgi:AcrR family transcriptional regulator